MFDKSRYASGGETLEWHNHHLNQLYSYKTPTKQIKYLGFIVIKTSNDYIAENGSFLYYKKPSAIYSGTDEAVISLN